MPTTYEQLEKENRQLRGVLAHFDCIFDDPNVKEITLSKSDGRHRIDINFLESRGIDVGYMGAKDAHPTVLTFLVEAIYAITTSKV